MGFLSLVALIPAIQGKIGTSICMLAADYLLDSQERKDRAQVYNITQNDFFPVLRWALGKQFVNHMVKVLREGSFDDESIDESIPKVIIERWNAVRGNSLYLYDYEPFAHNFTKIAQKWLECGRP